MTSRSDVLAAALMAGKDRKIGMNHVMDGTLWCYNTAIANRPHPRILKITTGGSYTATTRDRLNALLRAANTGMSVNRYGDISRGDEFGLANCRDKWVVIPINEPPSHT